MNTLLKSAGAAALAIGLALSPHARANIIISANGTVEATDPTDSFASFAGAVGTFNINDVAVGGVNAFGGSGTLIDVSSLDISTSGAGVLTLLVTETNLSAGPGATLGGTFSGVIDHASVSRAFYLDPTNSGLLTTLLGSTTGTGGSFTLPISLPGLFSLEEKIVITATGRGAELSSDDSVSVPEPASAALLGAGLLGLGMIRRRRA